MVRTDAVGASVSAELFRNGMLALGISLLMILVYIWFRFEWQFAVGAVVTLILDVTKAIGFLAITRIEFDLVMVAAILTVIGYSTNDKVVVYDRVRENLRKYKSMPLRQLIDLSINETLNRTLGTSMTVLPRQPSPRPVRRRVALRLRRHECCSASSSARPLRSSSPRPSCSSSAKTNSAATPNRSPPQPRQPGPNAPDAHPHKRPDQARKYGSTGPCSFIVIGLPLRSVVAPTVSRTQPSLTQYSCTLVFSTPLKRMPTPRSSRAAS